MNARQDIATDMALDTLTNALRRADALDEALMHAIGKLCTPLTKATELAAATLPMTTCTGSRCEPVAAYLCP